MQPKGGPPTQRVATKMGATTRKAAVKEGAQGVSRASPTPGVAGRVPARPRSRRPPRAARHAPRAARPPVHHAEAAATRPVLLAVRKPESLPTPQLTTAAAPSRGVAGAAAAGAVPPPTDAAARGVGGATVAGPPATARVIKTRGPRTSGTRNPPAGAAPYPTCKNPSAGNHASRSASSAS